MTPDELLNATSNLINSTRSLADTTTLNVARRQDYRTPNARPTVGAGTFNTQAYTAPAVNTLTAQLYSQGVSNAFSQSLNDQLRAAQRNYQSAQNSAYSAAAAATDSGYDPLTDAAVILEATDGEVATDQSIIDQRQAAFDAAYGPQASPPAPIVSGGPSPIRPTGGLLDGLYGVLNDINNGFFGLF